MNDDDESKINNELQTENEKNEIKNQAIETIDTNKEIDNQSGNKEVKKEKKDKKKQVESNSFIEEEHLEINKNLNAPVLFNGTSTLFSFILEQKRIRKDVKIVEIRPNEFISIQV